MSAATKALKATLDLILSPLRPQELASAPKVITKAQDLKGGVQPAEQLLQQLKGQPGVKASDLSLWKDTPPGLKLSPLELAAQAKRSPLFVQRGLFPYSHENIQDRAVELLESSRLNDLRAEYILDYLDHARQEIPSLIPPHSPLIGYLDYDAPITSYDRFFSQVERAVGSDMYYDEILGSYVDDNLDNAMGQIEQEYRANFGKPMYQSMQRLPESKAQDEGYFESVIRGAPIGGPRSMAPGLKELSQKDHSDGLHFRNAQQIGHIRGTINPESLDRMIIDEIQSDPRGRGRIGGLRGKISDLHPELDNVYGKLGSAIIELAAKSNVPRISIPTGEKVGSVRPRGMQDNTLNFYKQLYDGILGKSLYSPLRQRGVDVQLNNGFYDINLTEQLMREIAERGLPYKRGGLAQMGASCQK